jgi:molybdopterin molybdotransferase
MVLVAELIGIEEARHRVLAAVRPLRGERVPLDAALGRVLAEEVRSRVHVPPFDSSAMDGFAVGPDAEGTLEVVDEARAGVPASTAVAPGTAVRISTGAAVPPGTGAVVPVERTESTADKVTVPPSEPGANVRRRGEDIMAGDRVMSPGEALRPAALGVLASLGRSAVLCAQRPEVAILATGDELVEPGGELGPGQIWNSNPPALAGQVREAGGAVERIGRIPDDPEATRSELESAAATADVVAVSGGVSVGPHDHVKGALAAIGAEEVYWGVALRPGKPTWFGTLAVGQRSVAVFGLPGNPVSAMVCFQLFVRPALRALQGADPDAARTTAVLDEDIPRNPRRDEAVRCRLSRADDGLHAAPTGPQGSHVLTSMLAADALALVEMGEGAAKRGQRIPVELLF